MSGASGEKHIHIFVDNTGHYLLLTDNDVKNMMRLRPGVPLKDIMTSEGYKLFGESFHTYYGAVYMLRKDYPYLKPVKYTIVPIAFKEACRFVNRHHRHHPAPQGSKFSIGAKDAEHLIGVAIAGRPLSRHRDDGATLEITRVCVIPGYRNACSLLYSKVLRIAKEMGYHMAITYTMKEETGSSLAASGFSCIGESRGGTWNSPSRTRRDIKQEPKNIWVKEL